MAGHQKEEKLTFCDSVGISVSWVQPPSTNKGCTQRESNQRGVSKLLPFNLCSAKVIFFH